MNKPLLEATATLTGITIGAGILGIPYVVAQSGLFIGLMHLIILGIFILILNLYVGEIALRTKGTHELTGYASLYLGRYGKKTMTIILIIGIYGALIAYLIGEGQALAAIFNYPNDNIFTILFFIIVSPIIFFGLKIFEKAELAIGVGVLSLIFVLVLLLFPYMQSSHLTTISPQKAFIPYGVILFAFLGATAIPEMKEELRKNKKQLKKAIIIGSLIPLIVYLLFTIIIIGVTGESTTEIATIGLGFALGKNMLLLGNIFAVLTMTSAFLGLGLALKWMYIYDYKINNSFAFLLTCFIPLFIALLGITTFIKTLALTGVFAGGIQGLLLILIYRRAKKLGKRKPEYALNLPKYVDYSIMALFLLGLFYTLAMML